MGVGDSLKRTSPQPFWGSLGGLVELSAARPLSATSTADLTARLQIEEAFARFGIAHDENRVDVLLSVFTEDAEIGFGSGSALADLTFRGSAMIRDEFTRRLPSRRGQKRHCITNVVVEQLEAGSARAVGYGIVTRAADGLRVQASVLYRGELSRCDDGFWRFSRFFIGVDEYAGEGPT